MNSEPLRLGSRRSPMAIAQSGDVARLITERTGRRVEIVGTTTLGDVSREQLAQIGGTVIPQNDVPQRLAEIPRDRDIILFCS